MTTTTVTATYLDPSENPCVGRVTFQLVETTYHDGLAAIFPTLPVVAVLDSDGAISIELEPTSGVSADFDSDTMTYQVTERINGADRAAYYVDIPTATSVDLGTLTTYDDPPNSVRVLVTPDLSGVGFATTEAVEAGYLERVPPSVTLYDNQVEVWKYVHYQNGDTLYASSQISGSRYCYKSTDRGRTWTTLGDFGNGVANLIRVEGTGTLIGLADNLLVRRSTNDGTTWTTTDTLNLLPLGPQGMTATPSGYILIGEYGNTANTTYRIRRSTDDGATWSTVFSSTPVNDASDPGHIHSIMWDKYADCFVAFCDLHDPKVYKSTDEGATWVQIGTDSTAETTDPNFVAAMFFEDYVAWGFDNTHNGVIVRLPRADFYAGNWDAVETIYEGNRNAFYHTMPIRDDQWIICAATETIGGETDVGTWASDQLIVYDNGSKVTAGFRHLAPAADIQYEGGQKARPPAVAFDLYDLDGDSWINLPASTAPTAYVAVPYSVGSAGAMPRTFAGPITHLVMPNNVALRGRLADDSGQSTLIYLDANNRTIVQNSASSPAPEIRLYESTTDLGGLVMGGTIILGWKSTGVQLRGNPLYMGTSTSTAGLFTGAGSPEGVQTAYRGSLYLRNDGGASTTLYVKESGTGNTGWVAK